MYLVLLIEYGKRIVIVDLYLSQQKINQSIIFYISNNYDSFFLCGGFSCLFGPMMLVIVEVTVYIFGTKLIEYGKRGAVVDFFYLNQSNFLSTALFLF